MNSYLFLFGFCYIQISFSKPISSEPRCDTGVADIVFCLDTSSSIWKEDFVLELEFVQNLINHFTVGKHGVRVGVLTFGTHVYPQFNLNDFFNEHDVTSAVALINFEGGGTNTGAAIKYTRELMFAPTNGGRVDVPRLNIIVTDGFSQDFDNTTLEASISRSVGIHVIGVGVGHGGHRNELKHIASNDNHGEKLVFTADDFTGLSDIVDELTHTACTLMQNAELHQTLAQEQAKWALEGKEENDDKIEPEWTGCSEIPTDVFFLLDSSSSLTADDYRKTLHFVTEVINLFNMPSDVTRISVVGYSDGIHPFININNDYNKHELKTKILHIPHIGGSTRTGDALRYLRKTGLAEARQEASKMTILVTDGMSVDPELADEEAKALRELGVQIFTIGVGVGVDVIELETISGGEVSETVFLIDNYSALTAIKHTLATTACAGAEQDAMLADADHPRCQMTSPLDILFTYDRLSLPNTLSDHLLHVITQTILTIYREMSNVQAGILSLAEQSIKNLPIGKYQDKKTMVAMVTTQQDDNLPLLLREARTKGFSDRNGGRLGTRKVVAMFVYGELNSYTQLQLELNRLRFQNRFKVIVVYIGKEIPRDVNRLGRWSGEDHMIHMQASDNADVLISKLINHICET